MADHQPTLYPVNSQEQLITSSSKDPSDADWIVMDDLSGQMDDQKNVSQREEEVPDTGDIPPTPLASSTPTATTRGTEDELLGDNSDTQFRVYKRRWFGLTQLVLLNIVVSWDVSYDFCCIVWRTNRLTCKSNEVADLRACLNHFCSIL